MQVTGNTIYAVLVGIDNSRFAILVSTHFGISADYILRKRLKEFVARNFRTTVNNRLDEKFLIGRQ